MSYTDADWPDQMLAVIESHKPEPKEFFLTSPCVSLLTQRRGSAQDMGSNVLITWSDSSSTIYKREEFFRLYKLV